MAVQSQQDVVNQSLSTDALSSVDASAFNATVPAARAADFHVSNHSSTAEHSSTLADDPPRAASDASEKHKQDSAPAIRVADASDQPVEEETKRSGSVLGEGSVGSDTDTSRADGVGTSGKDGDGRDGASRSAVKKSASFKPVSVTKNFLAKAGSATASTKSASGSEKATGTPGGSPGPSLQNTPRPRLVAKTISSQKAALPKTTASSGPGGATTDSNQVWNKNRVQVQTATPKHLTDEELRQQYGIQLATRPIEDPNSDQAKWADIDDEDDDWAPETIEWNDGTKINLAETAAAQAAAAAAETEKQKEAPLPPEAVKPSTPQAKASTAGANPTVLKLGAASQQKATAATSKSSSEKPTLVARPAAPTAIKSPWAQLPSVDKVSPVQMNSPSQPQPPNRFGPRDAHGFDAMPPPAKEMEADDFSRFSRDMTNGNPRELYIPHSGRYEPVNDARRPSVRREGNFRQPAVLQRPSQGDRDQNGPAEPSAAFQTNRTQQDGPPWGRRRGSSSASMENGRFPRRMSVGRSYDPQLDGPPRRGSQYEQPRNASPSHSHGISNASQSPTTSTAADAAGATGSGPGPMQDENTTSQPANTMEDVVAAQKRLMREKREAAIKRRQEEEAREEAERKERIRLKLEKMGPAKDKEEKAPSKEQKTDEATSTAAPKAPTKDTKDTRPILPESPPKPPIPSPSGEPQQYGLMKVHAPQPAHLTSPRGMAARPPQHPVAHDPKTVRAEPKPQVPNGEAAARPTELLSPSSEPPPREPGADARTWASAPQQSSSQFSNWGASTMATHSPQGGNLWGPPSNHRALGNGDFQSNIQRASLKAPQPPYTSQASSAPQPIGTPRQFNQQGRAAPGVSSSKSDLLAGTIIEDVQTMPSFPSESERVARPRTDLGTDARSPIGHHHMQTSPGMPSKPHTQPIEPPQTGVAAWAHFSQSSGGREAEQAAQEHATRMAEQQLGLGRGPPSLPTLNETWKQVKRGDGQGTRQVVGASKVMNNYAPSSPQPQGADFDKTIAPPSRSRYQGIFEHQQRAAAANSPNPRSPSPTLPPPDSAEHPAFGLNNRPLVNLPGRKLPSPDLAEKPVVKLPPPKQLPPPPARMANVRSLSYSNAVKAATTASWQTRFDTLFDRETKVPSPPVLSATKPHFDVGPLTSNTAVSLPRKLTEALNHLVKSAEEEEALFEEERAFGSTPTIRVPQKAAVEMWDMAPQPDYKKLRTLRDDMIVSVRPALLIPGEDVHDANSNISIMLPGMSKAQLKPYSRKGHAAHRIMKPGGSIRGKGSRPAHKPRTAGGEAAAAGGGSAAPSAAAGTKGKGGIASGRRHSSSYNRRTTSGAVPSG